MKKRTQENVTRIDQEQTEEKELETCFQTENALAYLHLINAPKN